MTDNLRDRIEETVEAAIKRGTDCDYGPYCPSCLVPHVAYAVIRELERDRIVPPHTTQC